jgi:glycosyltransferase involved in cell wall biosynthesis
MENNLEHKKEKVSIIVPAYNEAEVIIPFHKRLSEALSSSKYDIEVIYVNDGSRDLTLERLHQLRVEDKRIGIISFSRNFGKEIAMTAGLDYATGDAVVIIDADLQDPPELINELINQWQSGYEIVYAKRLSRSGEGWFKKLTAHLFYRTINKLSTVEIPEDTGDFRLMSRKAVESLKRLREHHRFMKGLFAWIGYSQVAVPYHRDPRFAGKTKWNYWKLWNFALEGITSFTIVPLKMFTYFGLLVAEVAFLFAFFIIYKTLIYGDPVRGYPSLMTAILFLGGIQLIGIGILGEYLGRIFNEIKNRPLYLINEFSPPSNNGCPDIDKRLTSSD